MIRIPHRVAKFHFGRVGTSTGTWNNPSQQRLLSNRRPIEQQQQQQQQQTQATTSFLLPHIQRVQRRSYCGSGRVNQSSSTTTTASNNGTVPSWATFDPKLLGTTSTPYAVQNIVNGTWQSEKSSSSSSTTIAIPHPYNNVDIKYPIFTIPNTTNLQPFMESLRNCSKTGLHNPYKNVERYIQYGDISRKAGAALMEPHIMNFFIEAIQICVPKSRTQAMGEVMVTAKFLNNFAGDNVRRLVKSFGVPGDHYGQMSTGHRFPYGPVAIITPFNFPLEIPVLQLMGALYMGNKPVLKPSEQTSIVMEQFIRLLHHCGMETTDVDLLNCRGPIAQQLITETPVRLTQFTGSSKVGELLAKATNGKVKLEDAGFDWKVIGPDVGDVEYVAWQCDQDAYATTGQKCSAQSIIFMHENWHKVQLLDKLKALASRRKLDDFTIGPCLTVKTKTFLDHTQSLANIPGAEILWGGKELSNHKIPLQYGAVEPTAVYVPLAEMMKDQYFDQCVTEIFAPFQVITYYNDDTLPIVLEALERMSHHLTAAIVSNDVEFQTHVLAHTVNGTTYAGRRARTTGAPQNHHFGPAGDPRGASIGTPEAIQSVWSCHREIIHDTIVPSNWTQPETS